MPNSTAPEPQDAAPYLSPPALARSASWGGGGGLFCFSLPRLIWPTRYSPTLLHASGGREISFQQKREPTGATVGRKIRRCGCAGRDCRHNGRWVPRHRSRSVLRKGETAREGAGN